jgi:hypothetical protein
MAMLGISGTVKEMGSVDEQSDVSLIRGAIGSERS